MGALLHLKADLAAARRAAAARPVADLRHIREFARLAEQVGRIAARRLSKRI